MISRPFRSISNVNNFKNFQSRTLKEKLDKLICHEEWEADDIIGNEHDYSLPEVLDCIIYYVTGFYTQFSMK